MTPMKLKAIDFFCGGGGMSLGMQKAGVNVLAGIDNDPKCRETYEANHPHSKFIEVDITQFGVEELACQAGIARNDDSLVFIGCSPCQYWSVITGHRDSKRKNSARKSRNLLGDFLHFVEHYRPGFVVIENVPAIDRSPDESGLSNLYSFLDSEGYAYKKGVFVDKRLRRSAVAQAIYSYRFALVRYSRFPQAESQQTDGGLTPLAAKKKLSRIGAGECDKKDKLHKCSRLSDTNLQRLKLTPEGGLRSHWQHRDDLQINAYRKQAGRPFPKKLWTHGLAQTCADHHDLLSLN